MTSNTMSETFKTELTNFLSTKLESFILNICKKYEVSSENVLNDWKQFTGNDSKPKTSDPSNIQGLKEKCRSYGLKISGKKSDLIERIRAHEAGEIVGDSLSIKDLKLKLKEKGLKVSGKKDELIARLQNSDNESESDDGETSPSEYKNMKLMELRLELKTRGLKSTGKKDELIARLEKFNDSLFEDDESDNSDNSDNSDDEDDYKDMTNKELRKELKGRALCKDGTREEMIGRLQLDDEQSDSDSDSDSDSECESECDNN